MDSESLAGCLIVLFMIAYTLIKNNTQLVKPNAQTPKPQPKSAQL